MGHVQKYGTPSEDWTQVIFSNECKRELDTSAKEYVRPVRERNKTRYTTKIFKFADGHAVVKVCYKSDGRRNW